MQTRSNVWFTCVYFAWMYFAHGSFIGGAFILKTKFTCVHNTYMCNMPPIRDHVNYCEHDMAWRLEAATFDLLVGRGRGGGSLAKVLWLCESTAISALLYTDKGLFLFIPFHNYQLNNKVVSGF